MTDKDIKKALHRCSAFSDCRDCPLKTGGDCIGRLAKESLGMINRLEKDIEGLKQRIEGYELEAELEWEREKQE
jgi:hypothetical protein